MKQRYHILDEIRGITLCSMILYHMVWDLVYMFGTDWAWYRTDFAYVWQQSICWSFILLSGFCFSLGKRKWRRGLIVFSAGIVISLVTELLMPANRIRFGVLTLLGSCMLIMASVECIRNSKAVEYSGLWTIVSFLAFVLTKRINYGYLGFADVRLFELPQEWYTLGDLGNFLGFTTKTFYSTDYFSLMPWFFLFLTGYFLHKYMEKAGWLDRLLCQPSLGKWWRIAGKHSLLIYMLHQPVVYGVLYLFYVILPRV